MSNPKNNNIMPPKKRMKRVPPAPVVAEANDEDEIFKRVCKGEILIGIDDDLQDHYYSSSSSSSKPEKLLTRSMIDEFFDTEKYTDRQRLSWSYRSENKIRLSKLIHRRDDGVGENCSRQSCTLNSAYLFDVYPEISGVLSNTAATVAAGRGNNKIPKDIHSFDRKCHHAFFEIRNVDKSFDSIHKLDMSSARWQRANAGEDDRTSDDAADADADAENISSDEEDSDDAETISSDEEDSDGDNDENHLSARYGRMARLDSKKPIVHNTLSRYHESNDRYAVPPNLLYFEIILVAYVGYEWPAFHSTDPALPRAAIMGGAVVASLTSWRDPTIQRFFREADLSKWIIACSSKSDNMDDDSQYFQSKKLLIETLNKYFMTDKSPFYRGDVDVFLQISPFYRTLMKKLRELGMDGRVISIIEEYVGGYEDLTFMADKVYNEERNDILPFYKENDSTRWARTYCASDKMNRKPGNHHPYKFIFALSRNTLNTMLTKPYVFDDELYVFDDYSFNSSPNVLKVWPRTLQMIMLNKYADLVGGLMDFDLSLCGCAYDGNSVRVTPRAAFSLVTFTQIITPFIIEEKRNLKRIEKYYKRGFQPYIFDPNCIDDDDESQGIAEMMSSLACTFEQSVHVTGPIQMLPLRVPPNLRPYPPEHPNASPLAWGYRIRYPEIYSHQEQHGQTSCCKCRRHLPYTLPSFTFAIFEKAKGEAMDFFSKHNNWSKEDREEVNAVHEWEQVACRQCRIEYEDYAFLKRRSDFMGETAKDLLTGDRSLIRGNGKNLFHRTFYSGGVFDSRRCGNNAITHLRAISSLESQLIAEKMRWEMMNGRLSLTSTSDKIYKPRFAYGSNHTDLFEKHSMSEFHQPKRSPVGLNPERFVKQCEHCQKWLIDSRYEVTCCDSCEGRKIMSRTDKN